MLISYMYSKHLYHTFYIQQGQVEVSDQVEGLEYCNQKFNNCIDFNKIAVYGWSYGGYLSLCALYQRPDVFKVLNYFFVRA